jgi:hypothetical protein
VQEQQDRARGVGSAQVHLQGPPARPVKQEVGGHGGPAGTVCAAAVNYNDLMRPLLPQ